METKTPLLSLPLMTPNQLNKEIWFNEAMEKLDNFSTTSVAQIIEALPTDIKVQQSKYIINAGEHKNNIAYYSVTLQAWRYLVPKHGMIVFVQEIKGYVIYNNEEWQPITQPITQLLQTETKDSLPTPEFKQGNSEYFVSDQLSIHYIMLTQDLKIIMDEALKKEVQIIVKQASDELYKISFQHPSITILPQSETKYYGPSKLEKIDLIKIIPMPAHEIIIRIIT